MEPSGLPILPLPGELAKRFVVGRTLGRGGFGIVYEAFDRSLGTDIALKELLSMEPSALYAFKQEFRALSDVVHENLVGLHELLSVDGRFFLTMELVRGASFLAWVRPSLEGRPDPTGARLRLPATAQRAMAAALDFDQTMSMSGILATAAATAENLATLGETLVLDPNALPRLPVVQPEALNTELDEQRLRDCLGELAEGILAIHRAGRAHRDLKPSNVLVTKEGRVVILDFGLVGALESATTDRVLVVGTPAYMAPEQATGETGTAASDWYSVGVMLYEALTASAPHLYQGTTVDELLYSKNLMDPPAPIAVFPSLPQDLSDLAMRLLDRNPATRADSAEIFRVIKKVAAPANRMAEIAGARPRFVGRTAELVALREAWDLCVEKNQLVLLHVHGPSGMGKSDLVRHFFEGLDATSFPIFLEGRCHEREWVPYKAFDGAIDVLARFLGELHEERLTSLLPVDFSLLKRLFPVLGRVEQGQARANAEDDQLEPHELRRRAFEALRVLCERLAAVRPLVFFIDDLQWADTDSAALFEALLAAPAIPRLLFVASYRTEEAKNSALVAALPHPAKTEDTKALAREVIVGPLSFDDAKALALSMLGDPSEAGQKKAERIAHEAGGSPFFVQELTRFLASGHSIEGLDLRGVVAGRVEVLPDAARLALEIVSTAGRPIEPFLVKEAAHLDDDASRKALAILRSCGLLRAKGGKDEARVETYHDKIREIVVAGLSEPALAARHRALGEAMEQQSNADPEALAMHFRMAGEPSRARAYMERAAARAERVLAFDRAASLYRLALELADPADRGHLLLRLGDTLAKAGHGAEAAQAFLSASNQVEPQKALVAKQRAVEHWLRSGHMEEGLAAVRELLPSVGMSFPKTPRHAFMNVLLSRVKMKFRGLDFVEKQESEIDPQVLHRIDLCWSLGNGLGGVDAIRGADFQARHLFFALEAGEPYRIARALSWEAVLGGRRGDPASLAEAKKLADRADSIAERIGHPHAIAWVAAARALIAINAQHFREGATLSARCIQLFREARSDATWEVGSMLVWWLLPALFFTGQLRELVDLAPRCITEAQSLGDRYMETALFVYMSPIALLVQDKPKEALQQAQAGIDQWSTLGFHTMHWGALNVKVYASFYQEEGRRAYALLQSQMGPLMGSMLPQTSKGVRTRLADFRARAALYAAKEMAALEMKNGERLVAEALSIADEVELERTPWAEAVALSVRAAVFGRRGDVDRALALYARARSGYFSADMDLFAKAIERRMGELRGGETGKAEVEAADAWMRAQGVVRPDAMMRMLSAG